MGGDNFNKTNSDSESLVNALKNAQEQRESIENNLKIQLQAQLDGKVAEYVSTLNLEDKIAEAAVKGQNVVRIKLNAHKGAKPSAIVLQKYEPTTGITIEKSWIDFYDYLAEIYSSDEIRIERTTDHYGSIFLQISWE